MWIVDKILYLSNIFEKKAETYGNLDFSGFVFELNSLLDKNLPKEEIEQWLKINENVLNEYNIKKLTNFYRNRHDDSLEKLVSNLNNGEEYLILIRESYSTKEDIKYTVKSNSFLKGYKHIPNLYIFKMKSSGLTKEPIEASLAHDSFMVEAINEIIKYKKNRGDEQAIEFVKQYKDIINKIRSSFSYTPKLLGRGADGIAFDIGKDKVLKIFQDSYSFNKAKESIERLHKNPDLAKTEAMIYDAGVIGEILGFTIYYYIMEKVKELPEESLPNLMRIINVIGKYIKYEKDIFDEIKTYIDNPKFRNDIKIKLDVESNKLAEYLSNTYPKDIAKIENKSDLNSNWLKNLCEEIIFKYLTGRGDLHMGNIGVTNYGNFKYFDPSHEAWENKINTPSQDSVDNRFQEINGRA